MVEEGAPGYFWSGGGGEGGGGKDKTDLGWRFILYFAFNLGAR